MMLTKELERRLSVATEIAKHERHEFVTLEHLLLALCESPLTVEIIESCDGNVQELKKQLREHIKKNSPTITDEQLNSYGGFDHWAPEFTLACQRILQNAAIQVSNAGKNQINDGHILVALFYESNSYAVYCLGQQGITQFDVIEFISHGISSDPSHLPLAPQTAGDEEMDADGLPKDSSKKSAIENFCVNLNEKAKLKKIDPVIGRDSEIERVIQVLLRRNKNNPLIIGEPGIGKTAIVEGLAQKIVDKLVPEKIQNMVIYSLDVGTLIAGTKFRGDFEGRLKNIIKEIKERKGSILFIDEIHTIVGAGQTSGGSMDASNLLKPALAQGEISCIGSTTYKEFREHFEKDRALNRRFQKIDVKEPTSEQTVEILKGLKNQFEKFHNVFFTDEAITAAVHLSVKHLHDKHLPDKAIDILDEAAASLRLKNNDTLALKIEKSHIEDTIAKMAQIPSAQVSSDEKDHLKNLQKNLQSVIFGQDEAVQKLVTAIKLARSGLGRESKPMGSFLFAGPTGVGKTEVAKQLAHFMGLEFVRFDMSEYMEKHAVAKLVGAPPGYVGFEEGGLLTEAVNKKPFSLVLLDEIEKAHSDLTNILLQVMDAGRLTDSNGRVVDFKNTIIILTTNAGASDVAKGTVGFIGAAEVNNSKLAVDAIKKSFAPEFLNRLDSLVYFNQLSIEIIKQVVNKFLNELKKQLEAKKVQIKWDDQVTTWLSHKGYDKVYGARPMARTIDEHIKQALVDELLFGKLTGGGVVTVSVKNDKLEFKY